MADRAPVRRGSTARSLDYAGPWRLSRRIERLIWRGDPEKRRYQSRSEVLQAILTAAVNAGQSREHMYQVLMDPGSLGGEHLRMDHKGRLRSPRQSRRIFDRSWEKAEHFATRNPPFRDRGDAVAEIVRVRDAAESVPWAGIAGGTDRSVLGALISIALRTCKIEIDADVRTLGEMAGVGKTTASRSLKRLRKTGWVVLIRQGRRGDLANTWRLSQPTKVGHTDLNSSRESVCPTRVEALGQDLWRWNGLGKQAGATFQVLTSSTPQSTREVGDALGITPEAARYRLKRLARYGLAQKGEDGWTRGPADPTSVSRDLGVAGSSVAQAKRHRKERAERLAYRVRLRGGRESTEAQEARVIEAPTKTR